MSNKSSSFIASLESANVITKSSSITIKLRSHSYYKGAYTLADVTSTKADYILVCRYHVFQGTLSRIK